MTRLNAPRGTRDIQEKEAQAFSALEAAARGVFSSCGYEEIRTPLFENVELFTRAVGETTDIVEKEMFAFEDRGGRKLALRPEGTAGVVRAYLEHNWDQGGGLKKLFYMGPMFRAERPQAGRFREFWQIGAECFGDSSPTMEVRTLSLIRGILQKAGLTGAGVTYKVNSLGCPSCRPAYREALQAYLNGKKDLLSEESRRRLEKNPLRVLDSKVDGPKLTDAPRMKEFLCGDCKGHHEAFLAQVKHIGLPVVETPNLVRGLDYYTRTVFEVTAPGLGSQDAVGAGGRYDGLVKSLGGPDVPAVGFALGVDRLVMAMKAGGYKMTLPNRVYVAVAGESAETLGRALAFKMKIQGDENISVDMGDPDKSLKSQLRAADGWQADFTIVVGEEELKRDSVILRDMKSSKQEEVKIDDVVAVLKDKLSAHSREVVL